MTMHIFCLPRGRAWGVGSQSLHSQSQVLLQPSCVCWAQLLLLRLCGHLSHGPWWGLKPFSEVNCLLAQCYYMSRWLQATALEFVVKTPNLNMPWRPHTERWQLCLANGAPRTLFIFKYFINFSFRMTKWPCVHKLRRLHNRQDTRTRKELNFHVYLC